MSVRAVEMWVPSSKSVTHRAFLLGALSDVPCRIERPLWGADCQNTLSVLRGLGAQAERVGDDVQFSPIEDFLAPADVLDCGNSGTTLRLMAGQVARLSGTARLSGDASLCSRPNGPLLQALSALGVVVASSGGRAPLSLSGPIASGEITLPSQVSSQYGSSLLLALSLVDGPSRLRMAAPVASRPYLHITRRVAEAFSLTWDVEESEEGICYEIPGSQRPRAARFRVPGDWSGAAFPLVAGALAGVPVRLNGLDPADPQGDRAIVELMRRFGQVLRWDDGQLCQEPRPLQPAGTVDLGPTPDLFPALAALASACVGTTKLVGAPSLRDKESDRIDAMAKVLETLGTRCIQAPDGMTIEGSATLRGGSVSSDHDHRIYMAARLLSLRGCAVVVDGAGCERVSYPSFEAHLERVRTAMPVAAAPAVRQEPD